MRHDALTLQQYLIARSVAHPPDPGVFVASLSFQSPPKSQVLFLQTLKERRFSTKKIRLGVRIKITTKRGTTDDKKHPSNLRGRKKKVGGGGQKQAWCKTRELGVDSHGAETRKTTKSASDTDDENLIHFISVHLPVIPAPVGH
jgi:hypothetical protein